MPAYIIGFVIRREKLPNKSDNKVHKHQCITQCTNTNKAQSDSFVAKMVFEFVFRGKARLNVCPVIEIYLHPEKHFTLRFYIKVEFCVDPRSVQSESDS